MKFTSTSRKCNETSVFILGQRKQLKRRLQIPQGSARRPPGLCCDRERFTSYRVKKIGQNDRNAQKIMNDMHACPFIINPLVISQHVLIYMSMPKQQMSMYKQQIVADLALIPKPLAQNKALKYCLPFGWWFELAFLSILHCF